MYWEGLAPKSSDLREAIASAPSVEIGQDLRAASGRGSAACIPSGAPFYEAVIDGLTFDLCARECDAALLRQDGEPRTVVEALLPYAGRNAVCITPGPHVAAADGAVTITRALIRLGAGIAGLLPDVEAVVWPMSEWSAAPADFASVADAWWQGGSLPVPGMVQFKPTLDGSLQSVGLAHFTGQELRIEGGIAADPSHAQRLGARLAEMLVHRGRLTGVEQFAGPSGEQLRLESSVNGRYVRAWPG